MAYDPDNNLLYQGSWALPGLDSGTSDYNVSDTVGSGEGGSWGWGGDWGIDWKDAVTAATEVGSIAIQYNAAEQAEEAQEQRIKQQKRLREQRQKEIKKQEQRLKRQKRERRDELSQRSLALMENEGGGRNMLMGDNNDQNDEEDTLG